MTAVLIDTKDTRLGWLAFLENTDFSLLRLRRDYLTIYPSRGGRPLKSVTESMCTAEEEIEDLQSKLMVTWGIKRNTLLKWMDLGPAALKKRTNLSKSTDLLLHNLLNGRTKKSPKR